MKNTKLVLIISLLFSALLLSAVNAGAISEDARRHMDRGQAAIEMAKSPDEYEPAIKEFEQAISLAPDWPAPYYNLGLAQEKAGKFREAVASLKQYLRLAPNAGDAETVKSLINKLEYKAEREKNLTIADIVDVLVSFGNEETWEIEKRGKYDKYNNLITWETAGFFDQYAFITRAGNDRIKVPRMFINTDKRCRVVEEESFNIIKIEGPIVKFATAESYVGYPIPPGMRTIGYNNEIEVVSKTHVKVRQIGRPGERMEGKFAGEYRKR